MLSYYTLYTFLYKYLLLFFPDLGIKLSYGGPIVFLKGCDQKHGFDLFLFQMVYDLFVDVFVLIVGVCGMIVVLFDEFVYFCVELVEGNAMEGGCDVIIHKIAVL